MPGVYHSKRNTPRVLIEVPRIVRASLRRFRNSVIDEIVKCVVEPPFIDVEFRQRFKAISSQGNLLPPGQDLQRLKDFNDNQPDRTERKVGRRTQPFDTIGHFFDAIM